MNRFSSTKLGPEQIRIRRDFQIPDTSSVSGGNEYQICPIHRISDLELVSGHLISEFSYLISDFSYLVSDFAISATGLQISDSDFLYLVSDNKHSDTGRRAKQISELIQKRD